MYIKKLTATISFDAAKCIGCRNCTRICFQDVWRWNEVEKHAESKYVSDCIMCYQCELACPNHCMEIIPPAEQFYDALVRFNTDERYEKFYRKEV